MPGAAAAWPGLMAGFLLKTSAVLALALLAGAAARKGPAAVRHFILSSALIGLLLLPLVEIGPLSWRSGLLPVWAARPPAAASSQAREDFAEPDPAGRLVSQEAPRAGYVVRFKERSEPLPNKAALVFSSPAPADNAGERARAAGAGPAGNAGIGLIGPLLAGLWAAGLIILVLRLSYGLAGAVRLTSQGTPLHDDAWQAVLERFLAVVSLRRRVGLKSHPDVAVPLTWGWRKPVILMPDGSGAWTDDERSSALFHELSHVKRADFLIMLLVRASLALFWWNPLCWVVYRELLKEQEIACDELVLRAGIRPSAYAASLLAFRRSAGLRWNPSAALLGLFGRSSFQERLAAILRQKITLMEVKMKTKIMLALALVAAVALIGSARPAAGREARESGTVLVETALPAAAQGAATAAVAQEKAKEQEKVKEAEKARKEKAIEKAIVVVGREAEGKPVQIAITEGDRTRTLVVDKPVTITKGKNGEVIITTADGKEPIVLKGEPLRLEIKGGRLEVIEDGETREPEEGESVTIVKKGGESGGRTVYLVRPDGKGLTYSFTPRPGAEARAFSWAKEGEPGKAWSAVVPDKAWAFATVNDQEMLEKIRALEKQVEEIKAKKLDLSALEDSLKKLEAELQAKEEKLKTFETKFDKEPGWVVLDKKMDKLKDKDFTVFFTEKDQAEKEAAAEAEEAATNRVVKVRAAAGEGAITIVLSEKGLDRPAYERALASLKKGLPDGYKVLKSEFEEDAASMTVTIAPPEGKPVDKTIVKKLVESLRGAVDKK